MQRLRGAAAGAVLAKLYDIPGLFDIDAHWRGSAPDDGAEVAITSLPVTTRRKSSDAQARAVDWITVILAAAIYGLWAAATAWHAHLPAPLLLLAGGWLTAWHSSLQHEIIHGHPTRWDRLNTVIGYPPLSLWVPFEVYRRTHRAHHATPHLTDPAHDPEARYLAADASAFSRAVAAAQATLLGRLLVGPIGEIGRFLIAEGRLVWRGAEDRRRIWALHLVAVAAVLGWLKLWGLPLATYLVAFVYPGAALSLLRSYVEHRADAAPGRRTAVVERAPVLGLLFLNNNLHAAHHDAPGAPWHALPRRYARDRARLLHANGGLVYDGYAEVVRRHLLRPCGPVLHPQGVGP